jgi:hypothetical protein
MEEEMTMTATLALFVVLLVSLLVSTVLVSILARPLRLVLGQLCPDANATNFWVSFTATMLYVAPLLFAVLFAAISPTPVFTDVIRAALAASLTGAFAALLVIGYQVSKARPRTA